MKRKELRASDIAALVAGELKGDGQILVDRPAPLDQAGERDFSFSDSPKLQAQLATTAAGLVLVADFVPERRGAQIRVQNPRLAFFRLVADEFVSRPDTSESRISPRAAIAEGVELGPGVQIGDFVSIAPGCRIGARVVIHAGAVLEANVILGDDCEIHAQVSLRSETQLGQRVVIHNASVLGADGFGYLPSPTGLMKVPQIGRVVIEDDVEIGANCCIDRATLGETRIGQGTKIDNLVQIAHNVVIGPHSIIVSQVGISGSTEIGAQAMIGGQAGLVGHLKIGKRVKIGAQSGVGGDLDDGAEVLGSPAYDKRQALRTAMSLPKIPAMRNQLRQLEARLQALEDQ